MKMGRWCVFLKSLDRFLLGKLIGLSRQRRGGAGRAVGLSWGDGVSEVGLSWGDGVGEVWGRHREGSVWIPRRSGEVPVKVRCGSREGSVWVQRRFGVEVGGRGINKAPAGVAGAIR